MKCYPVFHVSLLQPTVSNPLKGQKRPPTSHIVVNDKQEYEAEDVVDSKLVHKKLYYLIWCVGHDYATWEPANYLKKLSYAGKTFSQKQSY